MHDVCADWRAPAPTPLRSSAPAPALAPARLSAPVPIPSLMFQFVVFCCDSFHYMISDRMCFERVRFIIVCFLAKMSLAFNEIQFSLKSKPFTLNRDCLLLCLLVDNKHISCIPFCAFPPSRFNVRIHIKKISHAGCVLRYP